MLKLKENDIIRVEATEYKVIHVAYNNYITVENLENGIKYIKRMDELNGYELLNLYDTKEEVNAVKEKANKIIDKLLNKIIFNEADIYNELCPLKLLDAHFKDITGCDVPDELKRMFENTNMCEEYSCLNCKCIYYDELKKALYDFYKIK